MASDGANWRTSRLVWTWKKQLTPYLGTEETKLMLYYNAAEGRASHRCSAPALRGPCGCPLQVSWLGCKLFKQTPCRGLRAICLSIGPHHSAACQASTEPQPLLLRVSRFDSNPDPLSIFETSLFEGPARIDSFLKSYTTVLVDEHMCFPCCIRACAGDEAIAKVWEVRVPLAARRTRFRLNHTQSRSSPLPLQHREARSGIRKR